jgi:hypothetical protein
MPINKDKDGEKNLTRKYVKEAKEKNEVTIHSMFGACCEDVWSLPKDRVRTTLYFDSKVKADVMELVKSKRISGCSSLSQLANALFRALLDPDVAVRLGFWTLVQVNAPLYYFGGRRRPKEKGWVRPVENCYDSRRGWFYVGNCVLNKNGHALSCGCSHCRETKK